MHNGQLRAVTVTYTQYFVLFQTDINFLLTVFLTVNSTVVCNIMFFVPFLRTPVLQPNLVLNHRGHLYL